MNELEKLNCIALQYKWKLTSFNPYCAFLSNEIKFQNEASFRVGWNKKPMAYNQSPALFLLVTNLNKIGLRAVGVTVSTRVLGALPTIKEMKSTTITNSEEGDDENGTIQLFTAIDERDGPSTPCFTFTIYLTSVVDDYRVRQVDGLLGEQLLSSATNSNGTADFKLIAGDGEILPIHKFILAARSPVFAILFSEKESIGSMDCTMFSVDEVKQFIRFIYTGEFQGPASSNMMAMAVKCKVKTLENLCRAASQDITVEKMAELAMHLKPGYQEHMKNLELT